MRKPKVNEAQYAELVDKRMKEHNQYKNGMGVKLNPEGSIRQTGLTVIGGNNARSIMSWAENEVRKEYDLVVTP